MIERLKQEMARLNINARELASIANVGRSFVYDLLSGKSSNPTTNKMSAIAEALGVSLPYLISGFNNDNADNVMGKDFIFVPFLDAAQMQADNNSKSYLFNKEWLIKNLNVQPENLRVVLINGDGMYPTLINNDLVLVDTACKAPVKPGIFILLSGTSMVAKRIEFMPDKNLCRVLISSDNSTHVPYACDLGEVSVIGRVVWVAREV